MSPLIFRPLKLTYYLPYLVWSLALYLLICSFRRKKKKWKEINTPTHTHSSFKSRKTWEPNQSSNGLKVIVGWGKLERMSLNLIWLKNATQTWWSWSAYNGYLNNLHLCIKGGVVHLFYTGTCIQRKEYPKLISFVM